MFVVVVSGERSVGRILHACERDDVHMRGEENVHGTTVGDVGDDDGEGLCFGRDSVSGGRSFVVLNAS